MLLFQRGMFIIRAVVWRVSSNSLPAAPLALHRAGVRGGDPALAPHRASVRGGDPALAPHRASARGGDPALSRPGNLGRRLVVGSSQSAQTVHESAMVGCATT